MYLCTVTKEWITVRLRRRIYYYIVIQVKETNYNYVYSALKLNFALKFYSITCMCTNYAYLSAV